MSVIVFRRMNDLSGQSISWRLHGAALPAGSVPIRIILDETTGLQYYDILAVTTQEYQQRLEHVSSKGSLDNILHDLCERDDKYWDEGIKRLVSCLPEAFPLAMSTMQERGPKAIPVKWDARLLKKLAEAGANVNFLYGSKTALDIALGIKASIPRVWMSGNHDHINEIIKVLESLGGKLSTSST